MQKAGGGITLLLTNFMQQLSGLHADFTSPWYTEVPIKYLSVLNVSLLYSPVKGCATDRKFPSVEKNCTDIFCVGSNSTLIPGIQ